MRRTIKHKAAALLPATTAFALAHADLERLLWPLVALSDPDKFTVAVGVQYLLSTLATNWHHIAAVVVLASIPTIVLYLLMQWFMSTGVLGGAVRG